MNTFIWMWNDDVKIVVQASSKKEAQEKLWKLFPNAEWDIAQMAKVPADRIE